MTNAAYTQYVGNFNIVSGGYSDKGVRKENQDSFLIAKDIAIPTFIVADGAGGYSFGKEASILSVNAFKDEISKINDKNFLFMHKLMEKKYEQVNDYLYAESLKRGKTMMTTFSMVNVIDSQLLISNMGDTAIFRISEGKITRVSKLHSLAYEQYENKLITYEQYLNHPQKNIITRALGGTSKAHPYFSSIQRKHKDIFVICTDGVHNYISPEEILGYYKDKVHSNESLDFICKEIGNEVLRRNGDDNLTIVAFQIFEF